MGSWVDPCVSVCIPHTMDINLPKGVTVPLVCFEIPRHSLRKILFRRWQHERQLRPQFYWSKIWNLSTETNPSLPETLWYICVFMPLHWREPEALCFRVDCLFVHSSHSNEHITQERLWGNFLKIWHKSSLGVKDELARNLGVKGQRQRSLWPDKRCFWP